MFPAETGRATSVDYDEVDYDEVDYNEVDYNENVTNA
jgi:hypothetical protein